MKKATMTLLLLSLASIVLVHGQTNQDAKSTDPNEMGWMKGFPPEKEKRISAAKGDFFNFPALRYSVNHMREFFPTRNVPSAKENYYQFKTKLDSKIDEVTFIPWGEEKSITWAESLDRNYTDGIIVVHKGKIVYEKYFAGYSPESIHAAMSVSKSFCGTVASILVAQGLINPKKLVTDYIPELKGSGYEGATVENVMNMTTAINYSEDYNDPKAGVWIYSEAGNPFRPADYVGPECYYEYLPTLKKIEGVEHGTQFGYRTVNTEVLGWIVSRVTGKGLAQLVSELIWKPLGAKYDGYYNVDPAGIAFAGGGFSLNLKDMAAFGQMLLNNGMVGKKQVIPEKAVKMICAGGSPEAFAYGGYTNLKGWSYSSMWWITNNSHKAYMARGVHGQAIYIDPVAEMVIVRFASNPLASNKYIDPLSIPAYEAVADYLMKQ